MSDSDGPMTGTRLRIAVIDAQPLYRAGVVQTLRAFKIVDTVFEGDSAADALRIANKTPLDIMLLDLNIPGGGAEAIATVARMWPAVRQVVLTASERVEDVSNSLQSGARGYILKHVDGAELCKALRQVANNEVYLTPSLGARLITQAAAAKVAVAPPLPTGDLTAREEQILSQVSLGATNKEIARTLRISEKTVKYYMTNIMQKLQVRNRVEAVVVARKQLQMSA